MKIKGFNDKEQKLYDVLKDGEQHDIRELKKLFVKDAKARCAVTYEKGWGDKEVDAQAQSFVRNSVRRLCRDGWVDGPHTKASLGRGTYQLSRKGKEWTAQKVDVTASASEDKPKRQPKAKKEAAAKKAPKTTKKAAKAPKEKVKKVAKAAKKEPVKKAAKAPKEAKPANGSNGDGKAAAKEKAKEAAQRAGKKAAQEKAAEAARRAAQASAENNTENHTAE